MILHFAKKCEDFRKKKWILMQEHCFKKAAVQCQESWVVLKCQKLPLTDIFSMSLYYRVLSYIALHYIIDCTCEYKFCCKTLCGKSGMDAGVVFGILFYTCKDIRTQEQWLLTILVRNKNVSPYHKRIMLQNNECSNLQLKVHWRIRKLEICCKDTFVFACN